MPVPTSLRKLLKNYLIGIIQLNLSNVVRLVALTLMSCIVNLLPEFYWTWGCCPYYYYYYYYFLFSPFPSSYKHFAFNFPSGGQFIEPLGFSGNRPLMFRYVVFYGIIMIPETKLMMMMIMIMVTTTTEYCLNDFILFVDWKFRWRNKGTFEI